LATPFVVPDHIPFRGGLDQILAEFQF
jgi:hypothetical protein